MKLPIQFSSLCTDLFQHWGTLATVNADVNLAAKCYCMHLSACSKLLAAAMRYNSLSLNIGTLFSERELAFKIAICYRPSVCCLSVVCLSVVCDVGAPYSGG